jgi:hypothetical protein
MTEKLEAFVWWCYDEVCDCSQAVIERVTPRVDALWPKRERIWEGTFFTEGEGSAETRAELIVAAARYGIKLEGREGYTLSGTRELAPGDPLLVFDEVSHIDIPVNEVNLATSRPRRLLWCNSHGRAATRHSEGS